MGRDPLLGLVPVLYPAQPQKAKTAAGGRTEHRRKGNGGHGPPPAPLHASSPSPAAPIRTATATSPYPTVQ